MDKREGLGILEPVISWTSAIEWLAFPIGVGPSRGEKSVFFYLSFEHPFRK